MPDQVAGILASVAGAVVERELPTSATAAVVVSRWGTVHQVYKPAEGPSVTISYTPAEALRQGVLILRFAFRAWRVGRRYQKRRRRHA